MKRTTLIMYIVGVIIIFGIIFVIWAYDSGQIASHADVGPTVSSASQLQSLPNPDQSTFSKIFGSVVGIFTGQ